MRLLRSLRVTIGSVVLSGLLGYAIAQPAWACPEIDGLVDTNCDQRLVIVAFGDSITSGLRDSEELGYPGRLKRRLPNIEIVNLGISGEVTYQGRRRAPSAFAARSEADYALILEGVNDYYNTEKSPSITRNNILQMRNSARNVGAEALIGKLTATPRRFQRSWVVDVNRELNPYAKLDFYSLGTRFISFDGLHPSDRGYEEMAELVARVLPRVSAGIRPLDSDLDGVYDFAEARYGTNPQNRDSDGDGVSDGEELFRYRSNPLSLDSDLDGVNDGDEVARGANPADAKPGAPVIETLVAIP